MFQLALSPLYDEIVKLFILHCFFGISGLGFLLNFLLLLLLSFGLCDFPLRVVLQAEAGTER